MGGSKGRKRRSQLSRNLLTYLAVSTRGLVAEEGAAAVALAAGDGIWQKWRHLGASESSQHQQLLLFLLLWV